jgi:hypothetical protein
MASKKLKLIKPWGLNPKGAIIEPPESVASLLIQSGRAEAVEEPEPVPPKQKGKQANREAIKT